MKADKLNAAAQQGRALWRKFEAAEAAAVKTKPDPYVARDGKNYWNAWTNNYRPERDGYVIHAFCEQDRTGKTLCGFRVSDGGGLSNPNELDRPSCARCAAIMKKRGALAAPAQPERSSP